MTPNRARRIARQALRKRYPERIAAAEKRVREAAEQGASNVDVGKDEYDEETVAVERFFELSGFQVCRTFEALGVGWRPASSMVGGGSGLTASDVERAVFRAGNGGRDFGR